MPQENIRFCAACTVAGDRHSSPVMGHTPDLASVAAIAAADAVFTSMDPHCEKKSSASSGDAAAGNTPAFSIMYFSALLRHDVSCSHR